MRRRPRLRARGMMRRDSGPAGHGKEWSGCWRKAATRAANRENPRRESALKRYLILDESQCLYGTVGLPAGAQAGPPRRHCPRRLGLFEVRS
jgi:hypothetical protein